MLYWLLYEELHINVFKYITFRSFFAFLTAFFLSLTFGPYVVRKLKEFQYKAGGYVRDYTPDTHSQKKYTPTMGGILIVSSVFVASILWCRLDNFYVLTTLTTMIAFALIGFADDYLKIRTKQGLTTKAKFALQVFAATAIALAIYIHPDIGTEIYFPVFKDIKIDLGVFYIPFVVFMIVGTSNAVNLTDGLDGLAIGPALITAATYVYISYLVGNFILSQYLHLKFLLGAGELTIFLMALIGAGLGFLWYNSFPADMFMGDAGSLSIGAVLGVVAVLTKQEFILAIVGAIFVAETLSVILQVMYFRLTGGRRLFLRAPMHHHFELKNIPEPKIVVRVWIITIILAIIALSMIKVR